MPTNTDSPPDGGFTQWYNANSEALLNSLGQAIPSAPTPGTVTKKFNVGRRPKSSSYDPTHPLTAKKGFTFGCDPEGFLFNKKINKPVPAAGIIPGTKHEPHKVNKGAVQVDGMAVEFNIDPAATYEEWEENITTVMAELETMLPKGLETRWVPAVEFDAEDFDSAPDEAKELGCQPDFNAWDGDTNPTPRPENPYVRCAGGHVHTGWTKNESLSDEQHILNCQDVGKQYDWFLGGWSVNIDDDLIRRSLYGKMGAIRYKDYGVEYRVLSNFWVPDKALRLEVWNRMVTACNSIGGYNIVDRANGNMTTMLRDSINNHATYSDLSYLADYPILTLDPNHARL